MKHCQIQLTTPLQVKIVLSQNIFVLTISMRLNSQYTMSKCMYLHMREI